MLYLSHRIPYPPNKGDKIRSFNQIKYLSQAGYEIHLLCLTDQESDLAYQSELLKWCKSVYVEYRSPARAKLHALPWVLSPRPLSVPYFYSRGLQAKVQQLLQQEENQAVLCFSSVMAEYILRSKGCALHNKLLLMDFCDLDSDKWLQYSQTSSLALSWIYAREAACLLRYEQEVHSFFEYSVFVSQPEAELFRPWAEHPERIRVVQNGVDHEFFNPRPHAQHSSNPESQPRLNTPKGAPVQQGKHSSIVFTGAMDYQANVDGILWFCRAVWPELLAQEPGLRLYIVGSNPAPEVRKLASEQIRVTGFVEDVREYYELADVCIVPLRLARGVQNKALEAMAMARPVVATSRVLQGIQAAPGQDALLADSPEEFARQVLRLLQDQDLAQELGSQGREFVLKNYDWQGNLQELSHLLQSKPGLIHRPSQIFRGSLSPVYFFVFLALLFVSSLWPMQETSPGAKVTYMLSPDLQNFMHLPAYALLGLLLMDFLQHFCITAWQRNALYVLAGLSLGLVLELLQMLIPGRFFSVSDMLTNLLGLGLGLGVYHLWQKRKTA